MYGTNEKLCNRIKKKKIVDISEYMKKSNLYHQKRALEPWSEMHY